MCALLPSSVASSGLGTLLEARVAEPVDAADLKSAPFGGVSSSLTPGTDPHPRIEHRRNDAAPFV